MSGAAATIATLLVCCRDQPGLVASLAQVLYGHGANILDSDQHADAEAGQFFQRIRFDFAGLRTDRPSLERGIDEVRQRFDMQLRLAYAERRKRVALFVSRYDHCLVDLLWRHRAGEFECEIPLVISNHADLEPVAQEFGARFAHVPIRRETKRQQEAVELELLTEHGIDLVVLARYMQILTPEFIDAFGPNIINIHHSFLPAFVGSKPYHQAYSRGVKLIGATAHYVTPDLDEGPIIDQGVTRCSHRDAVRDLIRKGRDLEKLVLSNAVRWHLEDRVLVYGNKTVVFD